MRKCLVHITELNNQLLKKIMEDMEADLAHNIEDCYLMQRPEYVFFYPMRGLSNHPEKLNILADRLKALLRSGGYTFIVDIMSNYMLKATIKIPERYKD